LLRKTAAQIIKHATALQAAFTFVSMVALPPLVYWFYGAEYLAAVPLALALLLLSLPSALCILNSPLVRLFRRNIVSIMQALVSWVIMIPALLILVPRTGPLTAFTVAYGIGFLLPLAVTAYIFRTLLPVAQQESSS
jgi:O-antigen/teichoic acid export membrane protein